MLEYLRAPHTQPEAGSGNVASPDTGSAMSEMEQGNEGDGRVANPLNEVDVERDAAPAAGGAVAGAGASAVTNVIKKAAVGPKTVNKAWTNVPKNKHGQSMALNTPLTKSMSSRKAFRDLHVNSFGISPLSSSMIGIPVA